MDTKNYTNWAIIGAVVIVVLLGGWWLFMSKPSDDAGTNATTTPNSTTTTNGSTTTGGSTATATTTASGETLAVSNQAGGSTVSVGNMNLTRESWVAVRDSKSILGAARFNAGTASGTVKLLRPTVAGQTYQVVVYVDDGDKKFDFKVDALVSGVSTSFTAQ